MANNRGKTTAKVTTNSNATKNTTKVDGVVKKPRQPKTPTADSIVLEDVGKPKTEEQPKPYTVNFEVLDGADGTLSDVEKEKPAAVKKPRKPRQPKVTKESTPAEMNEEINEEFVDEMPDGDLYIKGTRRPISPYNPFDHPMYHQQPVQSYNPNVFAPVASEVTAYISKIDEAAADIVLKLKANDLYMGTVRLDLLTLLENGQFALLAIDDDGSEARISIETFYPYVLGNVINGLQIPVNRTLIDPIYAAERFNERKNQKEQTKRMMSPMMNPVYQPNNYMQPFGGYPMAPPMTFESMPYEMVAKKRLSMGQWEFAFKNSDLKVLKFWMLELLVPVGSGPLNCSLYPDTVIYNTVKDKPLPLFFNDMSK